MIDGIEDLEQHGSSVIGFHKPSVGIDGSIEWLVLYDTFKCDDGWMNGVDIPRTGLRPVCCVQNVLNIMCIVSFTVGVYFFNVTSIEAHHIVVLKLLQQRSFKLHDAKDSWRKGRSHSL